MQITDQGFISASEESILKDVETKLRAHFGNGLTIRKDGALESIFKNVADKILDLQTGVQFMIKQMDPETAVGVFQDALYERLGVERLSATKTNFKRKIVGAANLAVKSGEVTLTCNKVNYKNLYDFTTDANGEAVEEFECEVMGSNSPDGEITILVAPVGIESSEAVADAEISLGRSKEHDDEYRTRFRNSKAFNSRSTSRANLANLNKFVEDRAFLNFWDKNLDINMTAGTLKIVAQHNTTGEAFAESIIDTAAFGVEFLGDDVVNLKDGGEMIPVHFENAETIPVSISATVRIVDGYYLENVLTNVKQSISNYVTKRVFGLGSTVYGTEFIVPILNTDGIEAVDEVLLQTDGELVESLEFTGTQIPIFEEDKMFLVSSEQI